MRKGSTARRYSSSGPWGAVGGSRASFRSTDTAWTEIVAAPELVTLSKVRDCGTTVAGRRERSGKQADVWAQRNLGIPGESLFSVLENMDLFIYIFDYYFEADAFIAKCSVTLA